MGRHQAAPTPHRLPLARWARASLRPVAGGVALGAAVMAFAQIDPDTSSPAFGVSSTEAADLVGPTTVSAPAEATWTSTDADTTWLTDAIAAEAAERARVAAEAEDARLAAEAEAARLAQVEAEHAAARRAARSMTRGTSAPVASVPVGEVKQYAAGLVGADQWGCLDALWQRESGWDPSATNRSSGAFGIPQSLPGAKMASAGADWRTNPLTQVRWGVSYIEGRYGSPCAAWQHSQSTGWY
ncbi:transglycosylase SLT domain-containing protein [Cellulomonas sp.]|uniref:aggregation-promoting factor C-terminal-like domain-containing protein n=1 Tax=Cellulomonas sp. TaxID=40001 RepID=UPI0025BB56DB|nr:transglycosylase SLT domain-containing protein [Cellulomonas sp.]